MNYYNNQGGRIEVICGPMFAGKTEELIRRVTRMEYAHKNFLVFKPLIDNRYSIDEVVSHSKYKKKAINIKEAKEILPYITDDIQAIVVDEVQFFDESMIIPSLLAIAERITKLTAICMCCGEEATRTQRIIDGHEAYDDDPVVLVGAKESYEARCRRCHKVLHRG